ncbi:MAG: hypothetical protein V4535_10750 [Bacteroidota bacterium]
MKSLILSLSAALILFTSCKSDKKENTDEVQPAANVPFTVTVNAIVEKDDVFQIFYNEDGAESFPADQAVTISIKGKPEPQDLVFILPSAAAPMSLRFDIGANKDLKQVVFKGLRINYLDQSFTADGAQFFKYFYPNAQVEFDTASSTAKIKVIEGQPYDPIIGATMDLKAEIVKLYGKK